jgi:hypothetical protein
MGSKPVSGLDGAKKLFLASPLMIGCLNLKLPGPEALS